LTLGSSRIEKYGTGSNKRNDLQFFDRKNKLILTGEVKLPGTIQGQSAFNQQFSVWDYSNRILYKKAIFW